MVSSVVDRPLAERKKTVHLALSTVTCYNCEMLAKTVSIYGELEGDLARPKKIDAIKRISKDKDGKIIRNSSKETHDRVLKICHAVDKLGMKIKDSCTKHGWSTAMFYRTITRYGNCKETANKYGIGLKGDAEVRPAKIKAPKVKNDAYTMFDMPCRKEWTDEQKQKAIQIIINELKTGNSLAYAVCYANANMQIVSKWMREEPGLGDIIRKAESECSSYMSKCVIKSMGVAADKGRVGEVMIGCERRFPAQWGKIETIDITTRNEHDQKHIISIPAENARQIGGSDADFEIEEV